MYMIIALLMHVFSYDVQLILPCVDNKVSILHIRNKNVLHEIFLR